MFLGPDKDRAPDHETLSKHVDRIVHDKQVSAISTKSYGWTGPSRDRVTLRNMMQRSRSSVGIED